MIERASEIERYVCAMIQQAFMLFDGMMVVKMKMKKEWIGLRTVTKQRFLRVVVVSCWLVGEEAHTHGQQPAIIVSAIELRNASSYRTTAAAS